MPLDFLAKEMDTSLREAEKKGIPLREEKKRMGQRKEEASVKK